MDEDVYFAVGSSATVDILQVIRQVEVGWYPVKKQLSGTIQFLFYLRLLSGVTPVVDDSELDCVDVTEERCQFFQ